MSGFDFGGLIRLETAGSALLTGGAYGPEAGLVGMNFRFVIMAMVLFYLQRRCHEQGEVKSLTFPIKVYEEVDYACFRRSIDRGARHWPQTNQGGGIDDHLTLARPASYLERRGW